LHYQVLAPVKKALLDSCGIEVQTFLRTNGDETQISWSPEAKAWVIASANVTLLAQDLKQLKSLYKEESRYIVAYKIAVCWFKQL